MECSKHKRYTGKRPPRSDCLACWGIWHKRSNEVDLDLDTESIKDKQVLSATNKKYKAALHLIEELSNELEASKSIKEASVIKVPVRKRGERSDAVPIFVASDWHVEETVKLDQVGCNEYTLKMAEYRAKKFFQRVVRIIEIHQESSVMHKAVLALLGDFFSGNIHEELLENCSLPPIEAAMFAQGLLIGGIEFLLENTSLDWVIPCHSGNHARITSGRRYATEKGNSLEYMMYHHMADHFKDDKRVTFLIAPGYHSYLDLGGFVVRCHHGHALRYNGGVGGPGIPIRKKIAQWNKLRTAHLDLFGHLHMFDPSWSYVMNGSMIGYNDFALFYGFDYQPPCQTFVRRPQTEGTLCRGSHLARLTTP